MQEGHPILQEAVSQALPLHGCIRGDADGCWATEGNIFWRRDLFEKLRHGAHDIGLRAPRRLQWAEFSVKVSLAVHAQAARTYPPARRRWPPGNEAALPRRHCALTLGGQRGGGGRGALLLV